MKVLCRSFVVALLISASGHVTAQVLTGKARFCAELSTVYLVAAQSREGQQSPQDTYAGFGRSNLPRDQLTEAQIKKAINNTYFVPAFQQVPSDLMYQTVNAACLDNGPKYEPLQ
ncbi:hypothetical protein [Robbsia sp. KACC 23696]|uniref:hypothetical protein n=1 Tax=Robbsia sp. KACC 23696 TaxID=3149231 RepID=UPI00325BEA17